MHVGRLTIKIVLGLVVIGAISSVGVVMPRTIHIVGTEGAPVEAWAAYHYHGYRFGLVESLSYTRTGVIVRTDSNGRLRLPGTIYLRLPIDGWLRHRIDLLYAPGLHAAVPYPLAAEPSPRTFRRSENGNTIFLDDRTGDPELWMRGFDRLFAFVRYDLIGGWQREVAASPQTVDALAGQVIADYRTFIDRHADTSRSAPTIGMAHLQYLPAAERDPILARIRNDLAREPLWGPYVERVWGKRIAELEHRVGG